MRDGEQWITVPTEPACCLLPVTRAHGCPACAHEQEQWCPGPIVVLASDELSVKSRLHPSCVASGNPSIPLGLSRVCLTQFPRVHAGSVAEHMERAGSEDSHPHRLTGRPASPVHPWGPMRAQQRLCPGAAGTCQVRRRWGLPPAAPVPRLSKTPHLTFHVGRAPPSRPWTHLDLAVTALQGGFRSGPAHSRSPSSSGAAPGLAWVLRFSIRLCEDRCACGGLRATSQPVGLARCLEGGWMGEGWQVSSRHSQARDGPPTVVGCGQPGWLWKAPGERQSPSRKRGREKGKWARCVCACGSEGMCMHAHTHTHIYTDTCTQTHAHRHTWLLSWERLPKWLHKNVHQQSPDTEESPLRRLVPSDQIMTSPSWSSPCWPRGCSLHHLDHQRCPSAGAEHAGSEGQAWGIARLTTSRCLESSSSRAFWVSQTSSSARCRRRARACSCFCWSSCREGPASGPWPQPAPPPPPNFNKRARGAISENRRDPQRTPVLAGTLPQFPVPWVFWASLTVSLSFLPPSLPPKAAAVNPAVPRFRASSAQLPGGKGCAPITSNRKGLKGHSGGGTHLQGLEEAQGLLLEV